jgi:peptidoglycan/xylan/chitin deacetylase (PgdA/CDA1 family)
MPSSFERGVVMVSIDTEQIWGYHDCLSEAQFESRFPDAPAAHAKLLARLCEANVRATWFVVGGLALRDSAGAFDHRLWGLLDKGAHVRAGGEAAAPLWYCRSFLERLHEACPAQEIGLHGGLTHLVWTDARSTLEMARRELTEGIKALTDLCGEPTSFSFPRNREAYCHLLPQHGVRSFRGRAPALAWRLGPTIPGAILRASEELLRCTPPLVWPAQTIPGLWNIPSSMFFYPIRPARSRIIGLRSRFERFRRGMEAAARHRAVFHFCFHPENLVESTSGFSVLEDILEKLVQARDRGDVEIMTMRNVVDRLERNQPYDCQRHQ